MATRVYLQEQLASFPWSATPFSSCLQKFYAPLTQIGTTHYIQNSSQSVGLLPVEGYAIPFSYAPFPPAPQNSYLLSFLAQYFDYAQEEVLQNDKYSALQRNLARFAVGGVRKLFEWWGMDNVVFINNQLLSTNLYPEISQEAWSEAIRALQAQFPHRALVFRTLNEITNEPLIQFLADSHGAHRITCRQVYILPKAYDAYRRKRAFIRDQKLWEKANRFHWVKKEVFSEEELETILQYYHTLYIDKYSKFNPIYTKEMIRQSAASGLLHYYLLLENDTLALKAVQAVAKSSTEITTPFIGYDPNEPQNAGLYRFMNLQLMQLAHAEGLRLNMSSGAAEFKRQRGGEATFDNHMVICHHLAPSKQKLWQLIATISDKFVRPTFQKMKL